MVYHISLFDNSNGQTDVVTANPRAQRDTYFIQAGQSKVPGNFVEINANGGTWTTYQAAFPYANWIYTASKTYCFWDNTKSGINGVTQQDPKTILAIYNGGAGNLVLTVNSDGTISFKPA